MNSTNDLPIISTTLLNWNRADLLERTIGSYLNTISIPFELFVIDNASTDNSMEVIQSCCSRVCNVRAIFLQENRGGEAINIGLQQSSGRLLHVSENDVEYLPGWDQKVLDLFESFPNLGQLSLFSPVPADDEVWEIKPSVLRHSCGRIVYEAQGNIGTTSIFRRQIWERGVRFKSISGPGEFQFPDDANFSTGIKRAGYTVAWADHYLVKNLGHSAEEFQKRKEYYQKNYKSKTWVGEAGWNERLRKWSEMPKPIRRSFLFPQERVSGEKSSPSPECSEPQLWSMFDGWSAELEIIEHIYTLVRLTKPRFAVETGTWHGFVASAIGTALRDNGYGKLVSLDTDSESCHISQERVQKMQLENFVEVLNLPSLSYHPEEQIDFLFLDSDLNIRADEFRFFMPKLRKGAMVLFHDTSTNHRVVRQGVQDLIKKGNLTGFFINSPRGLGIFQFNGAFKKDKKRFLGFATTF